MQLSDNGTYYQIRILTSKEQSSGFLDVYKYIPGYKYSCILFFKCQNVSEEERPEPKNSNQARNFPKTSLCKTLKLMKIFKFFIWNT